MLWNGAAGILQHAAEFYYLEGMGIHQTCQQLCLCECQVGAKALDGLHNPLD